MNTAVPPSSSGFDRPATYRISVLGHIPARWRDRLDGMQIAEIAHEDELPRSTLEGELADQIALSSVLNTLVELHLSVLSVERLPVESADPQGEVE